MAYRTQLLCMIAVMTVDIGQRIQEERRRHGWDQAELARRLGGEVRQQTVSRWENGGSRPRRNVVVRLAEVFALDPRELLAAAGYTPLTDKPTQIHPPVRSRLTVLPVWELAADKFEELIADIGQALHPSAHVTRFGGPGHKQYGLDVVAEKNSRYLSVYQCKRHKEFGPEKVKEAVTSVTVEADSYFLVLSRKNASPEARREIQNHRNWTLWDAEDISRSVRNLPLHQAVRIVDTYFVGWREPFLGVAEAGPWLHTDEFFRPLTVGSIYTHDWNLVGRKEELDQLLEFVTNPTQRLGLVVGRGGIGKSRVLREAAERAEQRQTAVRFLKPGAGVKPENLQLLPSGQNVLVIIDDAHDLDDLPIIVGDLLRRDHDVKILMALRPYGLDRLANDLQRLGLCASDLPQWILSDLSDRDAKTLAGEALGPEWSEQLAEILGRLTTDCPFITVVAGVLIKRGDLDPACLDHEDTVRKEVLQRFRDVVVADPITGEPGLRRAVLDVFAALQPFRSGDPAFQRSLAKLIDKPYDRAISHIRGLEDAGVLLRRGTSMRIVPDLLGDVILAEACFDERSSASTGYLERAWEAAEGDAVRHIFINATRLDWQVSHDNQTAPRLTAELWNAVEDAIQSAGIIGRINIMKLLQKVANFQPQRSLKLVRWLIDHPTDEVEEIDDPLMRLYQATYDDVLHELPAVLRLAAYDLGSLQHAADMLWELAATDTRPTNTFPGHPLRILQDLAKFDAGKPIVYNAGLLDAAERWLERDEEPVSGISPFDILEPFLATEGATRTTEGFQLHFQTFTINPDSVRAIRQRAVDLALAQVAQSNVKRAVRAAKFLAASVRYPSGLFGRTVPNEEIDAWTPQFIDIIKQLGNVAHSHHLDPVVVIAIRQALHWHAEYSSTASYQVARQVREALPSSVEDRVALALYDGWGQLIEDRSRDFQQVETERETRMAALASELVSSRPDAEISGLLAARLRLQHAAFGRGQGDAAPFVYALVKARPAVGMDLCSRMMRNPDTELVSVLPVVIAVLAEAQPDQLVSVIRRLLSSDDLSIRRGIAQALGWNRGTRMTLLDGESDLLAELAGDSDIPIRQMVVRAAQRLAPYHRSTASDLICRIPFGDSAEVADDIFQIFSTTGELRWQQLPQAEADQMLRQLADCPSISPYWVTGLLSELSKDQPDVVVELLVARVERWETLDSVVSEYEPLPIGWNHHLQVRTHKEFVTILRRIRDWIASEPDSWKRQDMGGELFESVAQRFDPTVLAVLEEALETGERAQMMAVASLLRRAPRSLVFDNANFVRRALNAASNFGDEMTERVAGALQAAVISGIRTGRPGEPFREEVEQRDRSRAIADSLPRGSLEQKLYRSLEQSADETIRRQLDHDEKLMDGRDW